MLEILEGSIVTGKSGKPLKVISIDGDGLVLESGTRIVKAKRSAILRVISSPQATSQFFHIGDRVTLLDKFMVRSADVGTIEAFTDKGIQILWDNKIQHENLKQPPMLWRKFEARELELIESRYQQN